MPTRALIPVVTLFFALCSRGYAAADASLGGQFSGRVRPFLENFCTSCHGKEKQEAELDLSPFTTTASVVDGFAHWELVLERLEAGEMPPAKAKTHPTAAQRGEIIAWIYALRKDEALKNAGDPGPVLARRLSNAEYDYTIRDLTGADIRPTREFPVDPANQAGFDNSGESLAMSPALLKKYLGAARTVAEHLVLKPDGFAFALHPVVADTDRDKYAVLRIVDFYRRQPTDYAEYFFAAWRHHHGRSDASLEGIAAEMKLSEKYLATIWSLLTESRDDFGPLAALRAMWRALPSPAAAPSTEVVRAGCARMRDYVVALRAQLIPEVKNLPARSTGIQDGAQALVFWKNRQMSGNRRRYAPAALLTAAEAAEALAKQEAEEAAKAAKMTTAKAAAKPSSNSDRIQRGGKFLAPALTTTGSSATFQLASTARRGAEPALIVPDDPAERARHEAAFARFADVFPDAFYITERARVFLDAAKEKDNAGRLLSAGLHSQTGYFRDDAPLCDLILDEAGRRELDRLWREFDFLSLVPQRMHTSLLWFERTDSSFLRDDEFTPFRPEDKSASTPEKVGQLAALYRAKAQRSGASETVLAAITEHFATSADNIARVERERLAAEPRHVEALMAFANRAYRRPLSTSEREGLRAFYRAARTDNGLDHEEAMRDCIVSVLMSPHFCYRIDLGEMAGGGAAPTAGAAFLPLSNDALASRLSYFLWSSMPDAALLARAARGELQQPEVIRAEARRMLLDPRMKNFAVEFAGHWLDFRRFEEHNAVDRERFPAFDADLRSAMFEEPLHFLVDLVREDRSVKNFLYGDYTFVNPPLARHYAMPAPPNTGEGDGWTRVDQAGEFGRGGLLPMAVFLTANSPGLRTSPVKRGYWVVRRVLGERIPPPPASVPDLPNDERKLGELTLRETLAKHREDKSCAACHARFDAFGLVFEGYGPVGERRTLDLGGRAVDMRAEFPGGVTGTGLAGLRDYMHTRREGDFVDNLCRKLLAYGLGRTLLLSDDPLVAAMKTALAANGDRFSALIDVIVTSSQFRHKRASTVIAKTAAIP